MNREKQNPKLRGGGRADKLVANFRKAVIDLDAAVTSISLFLGMLPSDKLLAKVIRRREYHVLEFISLGDVKSVSDTRSAREGKGRGRGRGEVGEGVKIVTDSGFGGNRSLDRSRELYQEIKILLRAFLIAGATDYSAGGIFILKDDGAPDLN